MRIFNHRNMSGKDVCPICKTNEDGKTILIAIDGTEKGLNCQAIQVHLDCIGLRWNKQNGLIYQIIREKK